MKVILREDIEKLGKCGEVIEVKSGYGRNYLIARNMAIPATKGNLRAIGEVKTQKELRDRKNLKESERIKARMKKLPVWLRSMLVKRKKFLVRLPPV